MHLRTVALVGLFSTLALARPEGRYYRRNESVVDVQKGADWSRASSTATLDVSTGLEIPSTTVPNTQVAAIVPQTSTTTITTTTGLAETAGTSGTSNTSAAAVSTEATATSSTTISLSSTIALLTTTTNSSVVAEAAGASSTTTTTSTATSTTTQQTSTSLTTTKETSLTTIAAVVSTTSSGSSNETALDDKRASSTTASTSGSTTTSSGSTTTGVESTVNGATTSTTSTRADSNIEATTSTSSKPLAIAPGSTTGIPVAGLTTDFIPTAIKPVVTISSTQAPVVSVSVETSVATLTFGSGPDATVITTTIHKSRTVTITQTIHATIYRPRPSNGPALDGPGAPINNNVAPADEPTTTVTLFSTITETKFMAPVTTAQGNLNVDGVGTDACKVSFVTVTETLQNTVTVTAAPSIEKIDLKPTAPVAFVAPGDLTSSSPVLTSDRSAPSSSAVSPDTKTTSTLEAKATTTTSSTSSSLEPSAITTKPAAYTAPYAYGNGTDGRPNINGSSGFLTVSTFAAPTGSKA